MTIATAISIDAAVQPVWLSILLPVYNVELYLDECLASIIEQWDDGVEIVLCEDCSTDRSAELAERWVALYPGRIRMVRHAHNSGLSAARNTLIDAALGEWLWFVDSDDTLLPGAVAAVREAAISFAPDVISGDYQKRGRHKKAFDGPRGHVIQDMERAVAGVLSSRKTYAWLKIGHRRVWERGVRFPVGKAFEDAATTPSLLLGAASYIHLDTPLIEYRIRPGSILSGITRLKDRFPVKHHRDLAHALDGFAEALVSQGFSREGAAGLAASHFLAMEFSKICIRITRAGQLGCDGHCPTALRHEFRRSFEAASPVPFRRLAWHYLRRGRLLALLQLGPAMLATRQRSALRERGGLPAASRSQGPALRAGID